MKDKNTLQNDLNALLVASSYKEVSVYLKRNRCYDGKDSKLFWQSQLPIVWFNDLIKDPFLEDLLFVYFNKESHANEAFLKCFFNYKQKATLIKIIKLSEAFNNKIHWDSFIVFQNDRELKIFYKELKYVKAYSDYWEQKAIPYQNFIKAMTFEDIMFHCIMYYENFKRHSLKSKGNRSRRVSYEAILIKVLNTFLNLKKVEIISKGEQVTNAYKPNYFKTIIVEQYNVFKIDFQETIEFYFSKYDNDYQIKKYLTSFATFEEIEGLEAKLVTNRVHTEYRKTLEKSIYDETYFTNTVIKNKGRLKQIQEITDFHHRRFKLDTLSSLEYFKFLKLPLKLKLKKKNAIIDVAKVLLLLKTFSTFFMHEDAIPFGDKYIQRTIPKEFKNLFDEDIMVCYTEAELIEKTKTYFKWTEEDTKNILEFLTTDLNSKTRFSINIATAPLIKVGNQYFWLSNIMRDRRWEIALHKKIVAEKLINHNKIADESEQYLSEMFKKANFGAVNSYKYSEGNKRGEIDVLACKDNVLFICELKSTYLEEDIMKSSKYEVQRFNEKASDQLDKAKHYVNNNFEEIKQIKDLGIDCKKENLKIETIIISNIYQADHLIFNNRHLKISVFELLIILKNDLYNMLVSKMGKALFDFDFELPIDSMLKMHNTNNAKFKKNNNEITEANCNLWADSSNCTPNDIIAAIKENKVWQHQETNQHFGTEDIYLSKYDENYKYLG